MSEAYIVVEEITKKYKNIVALEKINFEINKGETLGVLGPNGAGKSTFVSIFTGTLKPTSGDIVINGYSLSSNLGEIKKLIGYVPQDIALYPTLTGLDNLRFWAELYGLRGKKRDARIDEVVSIIRMNDRIKDRVDTYSGGMKRRVNIAVGLLNHPEILILDEPSVGIDIQSRKYIFEAIKELKEMNKTILLVSHIMDEMETLCDKIAVLEEGKLRAIGTKDEVLKLFKRDTLQEVVLSFIKD